MADVGVVADGMDRSPATNCNVNQTVKTEVTIPETMAAVAGTQNSLLFFLAFKLVLVACSIYSTLALSFSNAV